MTVPVVYSDEWVWNTERDVFVNLCSGEEMPEDEFLEKWNNG